MARARIGRYEIFARLASGGMASVYLGRLSGDSGFTRVVAIKKLHEHLARDPEIVSMILDEARVASRVRHPNAVAILDVVKSDEELVLVMEYVHGEALSRIASILRDRKEPMPLSVVGAIISGVLQALHAAHEARDERGVALNVVHRDVSPQNILVGRDGVARITDFGIAKAAGRLQKSTQGSVKGKVAYMAPEQLAGNSDRRTDIFAAAIVLWELLTNERLFAAETEAHTITRVLTARIRSPREINPQISRTLEDVIMAALDREPSRRFETARDMDDALRRAMPMASAFDVGEWLEAKLGDVLAEREKLVLQAESNESREESVSPVSIIDASFVPTQREIAKNDQPAAIADSATTRASDAIARPRRRWPIIAVAALFFAAFVGMGAYAHFGKNRSEASTIPTASAALVAPDRPPASADVPSASAIASTSPAPSSSSIAVKRPRIHLPPNPNRRSSGSTNNNCNPPYVIDSRGTHFKPECL